ncbi:MAG: hypothetical protein DM484_00485 [Candidatus Methylumidiphilus alinenensis]|uniref:Uncharacterized protein n=1 Tax=Candidatus Methylumidiphilus alinenensis TaxID=2202197 RepID=A0A2W4RT21_9GAMM|nr:MAG: hypothetical protein DM484_00485 [Candidatus Methylumidiphilus alinenensis]
MPSIEATVIVGLDADGEREGRRLANRFPNSARYVKPNSLASTLESKSPLFVVLVSHDTTGSSIYYDMLEALKPLKGSLPIFVLAMCSSGVNPVFAGYTLAQRVAAGLRVEVRATSRLLTFEEVGQGLAFAQSGIANFILPSNDDTKGTANLWGTVTPPSDNSLDAFCLQLGDMKI